MKRVFNFYAGPSTLPVSVLEKIRDEIVEFRGLGLSIIETSHRSSEYEEIHNRAIVDLREIFGIPDGYEVLFLGGGATLQFSMVPLNFLDSSSSCDLVLSGSWAKKAMSDAKKVGKVNVLFDGSAQKFSTLPNPAEIKPSAGSRYVHITSNETIDGLQWQQYPDTGAVPLIVDMSSDILSRPVDVSRFAMIYAGAQKNIGPAGLTLVIIRKDLLERCNPNLTAYLNYKTHATGNSLYNTPPVFSIYAAGLVLQWIKNEGGLPAVTERNRKKASLIYDAIDTSDGFYRCPVDRVYRSMMNVVFRLKTEALEEQFLKIAEAKGMLGLPGHRSVGGCRASLYNALPVEGAQELAQLMKDFAKANG
ncbi:MAG TPA: 3-phosphoserine/phosphohydroxythreonine transaminase [Spirochaetia bacterium]|nr:3-phosphoserine/phosphohydroxythreonine transaminase [Spirochaetia bacterium]